MHIELTPPKYVHIEWNSNLAEMSFCTLFKEIQESSTYIYASDKCNNFMCVNM
jgi:hypothetical protein